MAFSIHPSTHLSIWKSARLPSKVRVDNIKNEAILRDLSKNESAQLQNDETQWDFLHFWSWQHRKQSNSARLPSKLRSWRPRTNTFCEFSGPSVHSTAPATKEQSQNQQNHFSKPEDLMLQNATPLRKSTPGPPYMSDGYVSCTAPSTRNPSLQILVKASTAAIVSGSSAKPRRLAHFWRGAESISPATKNDACTSKSGPNVMSCWDAFGILTSRRALPQSHALFEKCSENTTFCMLWLRHVLGATTTDAFSTSQLPNMLQAWGVLDILTSKRASRHSGVQFFISCIPRPPP